MCYRVKNALVVTVWTEDLSNCSTGGQYESDEGIFKLESDNLLTPSHVILGQPFQQATSDKPETFPLWSFTTDK